MRPLSTPRSFLTKYTCNLPPRCSHCHFSHDMIGSCCAREFLSLFLGEISCTSVLDQGSAQHTEQTHSDKQKIISNEAHGMKSDIQRTQKSMDSPMDVDSNDASTSFKRKRQPSDSDSEYLAKEPKGITSETKTNTVVQSTDSIGMEVKLRKYLTCKLTAPYKELLTASKFDLDGL